MSAQTEREPGAGTDGTEPGTPGTRLHGTAVPARDHSRSACARTIGATTIARQLARIHPSAGWDVIDPHDTEPVIDRGSGT